MKKLGFNFLFMAMRRFNRSDIKAVSEAIGTILLLGISVTLAGGVALWTAQIDPGEEGLYVDLWADVQGNDLVLMHKGGDLLDGLTTTIKINNYDGSLAYEATYTDHTTDVRWDPGDEVTIDLNVFSVSDIFDVKVITPMPSGILTVILSNRLYRTNTASGLPDLAITQVVLMDVDENPITRMNDDGVYKIKVVVKNYGSDMTTQFFSSGADNTVTNLRLFDSEESIDFVNVEMEHFDVSTPDTLYEGDAGFGVMENLDYLEAVFTWSRTVANPRALGTHILNVKVVPYYEGEINYRNNYVERSYKVDKLVVPVPIFGPDPGIYDITFSNDAPSSGDEITVTVIIQNSGDKPITKIDHHVNMIVSTWTPEIHTEISSVSYDWRVDYEDHYGEWRSESPTIELVDDNSFPTCVKTDIELLPGAYFFYYFTLEARVDVPGGEQWVYAAIDVYDNPEHREGIPISEGDLTSGFDNIELANIQVLPKIMLVDDDDVNPGSPGDMTSSVLESLVGSGVSVNKIFVTQEIEDDGTPRDAPAFDYIQAEIAAPAMEDYDIVIWVTGFVENPLTNEPRATLDAPGGNIQEMMDYLDSERYLLIVGASPFEGLNSNFNSGNTQVPSGTTTLDEFNDANAFIYKYLGISNLEPDADLPSLEPFHLVGTDTGENGLTPLPDVGDYELTLLEQSTDNDLCQYFTPRDAFIDETEGVDFEISQGMLTQQSQLDAPSHKENVLRSWSTPVGEYGAQYKACVMGFDITQIKYLNEKINLFASVLKWFDWEINVGRDLAVTKMELSIITEVVAGETTSWENVPLGPDNLPKYLDTIEIEVTVRNNGPISESTSVMFYATGPDNIELPITTGIPDPREGSPEVYSNPTDITGISAQGGEELIYKLWLAVGVGTYTFRVVVDPYHLITEISEENNDISYSTSTITSFVTQNNILVVDDDMSENNFAVDDLDTQAQKGDLLIDYSAIGGEPSTVISASLDLLEYDYETHVVDNSYDLVGTAWDMDAGLGILDLKRYNSIIWIMGDSGVDMVGQLETTTINDMRALIKYLDGDYPEADYLPFDHRENVMFIGQNMIVDLLDQMAIPDATSITVGNMMDEYLGLDQTGTSGIGTQQMMAGPVTGEFIDDVYVGIEYDDTDFDSVFDYNTLPVPDPLAGATDITRVGLFSDDGAGTNELISTQFEENDLANGIYFRTIIHSWQMRAASHDVLETSMNEILFLSMHWFDTPELKPELLSRNCKISFDNDNPVLGNAYLVTVEIANLGGVAGGGTVRFMDGNTLIKSETIFINPDQATTLEAIWTPLYAGERQMTIWIDKYDNYDEVFDVINNMPYQTRNIYFFWDDMESGEGNWNHESTNILINGEGKLDYMGEPTNVNIDSSWGSSDGFNPNTGLGNTNLDPEFHSSPRSFVMHEPSGTTQKTADIILNIDSSGSMGITYDNNDPDNVRKSAARGFVDNMYDESRVAIVDFDSSITLRSGFTFDKMRTKSSIGYIDSNGGTKLYDAAIYSMNYMTTSGRSESEAVKALIVLTDGQDTASINSLEDFKIIRDQNDNTPTTEDMIYVFTIKFIDGDEIVLKDMCTQPWDNGPFYFEATDPSQLEAIYARITEIIEDLSQASTRGTRSTPTRDTIFEDDFPTPALDPIKWIARGGDPISVMKAPQSNPYCLEMEDLDYIQSQTIDLSSYDQAYVEFDWRGGYNSQGALEYGDYLYFYFYLQTGWQLYITNNDGFFTPWSHEQINLPPEAMWSGFRMHFSTNTNANNQIWGNMGLTYYTSPYYLETDGDPLHDAYYLDNVQISSGRIGRGSIAEEINNPWDDGTTDRKDKFIETNPLEMTNIDDGTLSFYQKYNLERGSNGGIIMVGLSKDILGPYRYLYIQPDQPYTGNTLMETWGEPGNTDDFGNQIKWCWNGISASGTLDWEHVTVDLEDFAKGGVYASNFIKIKFQYLYNHAGTGYGWILDDVTVTTTTESDNPNKYLTSDNWLLKEVKPGEEGIYSHSGSTAWFCGDDSKLGTDKGDLKSGIDNSLYTRPIDLTNAKTAYLSAYFKFNFDNSPGRPPDGFRTEVSNDHGISWIPLSLGVRSSWAVSGTEADIDDGVLDGRSYTGIDSGNNWVRADTLTRLITDLSGFIGNVVILRFRVITNTDETHYNDPLQFKGFYIDDVIIYGESLEESRSVSDQQSDEKNLCLIESDTEGTIDVYEDHPVGEFETNVDTLKDDPVIREIPAENEDNSYRETSLLWILLGIASLMMAIFPIVVRKRYP